MVGKRHIIRFLLFSTCLGSIGCQPGAAPEHSVPVKETLASIAKRLSNRMSLTALNHLATDGAAFLSVLTQSERDHLGKDYLKISIEVPMTVFVAAPAESVPFWLEEQGFKATTTRLENENGEWHLFRRIVLPGTLSFGVNGLDRTPMGHYAVFLKPTNESTADPRVLVKLRDADQSDWRISRAIASSKVSPTFDLFKPFKSLPDELQNSVVIQAKHERRHIAVLAPAKIWKTHVASGNSPDQITISFGNDPCRELVWSWRTQPEVEGSRVRLRRDNATPTVTTDASLADAESLVEIVEGQSTLVETPCVLNDPMIRRHRVAVRGLQPDRSYLFSIGDGSLNGWSPWHKVRTAPGRHSHTQFLYLGDAQTGLEAWGRRLEEAYRQYPEARFALMAGDLVDRGNERTNWDHFFLRSAGVFDRLPLMPCVGNHEYLDQGPQLYKMFFDLPENGPTSGEPDLVYSFEYGDAFFAMLDSTMAVSSETSVVAQATWLDEALTKTAASWKFVMFHHPVYASRQERDNLPLQKHWVPIFDKHHVDIVFQGHDHTYIRTHPLKGNRRVGTSEEGTFYVVSVSGDKFYDQEPRQDYAVARTKLPTFQVVDIDPESGRLSYRSMAESGELVDSFEIAKPPYTPRPMQFANGK